MRTIPQPFFEALRQAMDTVLNRDELETFSIINLGLDLGFLTNVKEASYPVQLVNYLSFLNRKGKLMNLAKAFIESQKDNDRDVVDLLRKQFTAIFTVDEATGNIGLSKEQFKVVNIGPGMPFIGREEFRDHLREVLSGQKNVHNIVSLDGGARSGHSFLGNYLAEVGRKLKAYTIISIDFKRDLPVNNGEQITGVHLADTISRRIDGLEEYQNMHRDRPDDFKLSSFSQSLIRQLQASDQLYLFFFDHLNYVPLTDSVLDMIVYLADKIARPDTPGVMVTSGLHLRPQDQIFGDQHHVSLESFTRKQVAIYFNYLYDSISTPEAREDRDAKRDFLRETMTAFPVEFFDDPAEATVVEIGQRCRAVTEIVLSHSEPAEEDVEEGLILDF
jgi:hypothetical protein